MSGDITTRWEKVHAIFDFLETPNSGIANFGAEPHVFHRDPDGDGFWIRRVGLELFTLALQDLETADGWEAATKLSGDLAKKLKLEREGSQRVEAEFREAEGGGFEVNWSAS